MKNAKRCKKCYEIDCFDPDTNTCWRCELVEIEERKALENREKKKTERKNRLIGLLKYIVKTSLVIFLVGSVGSILWLYINGVIGATPAAILPMPQLDPIFEAIENNSARQVELLVHEQPRRLALREPKRGWSPLHMAVSLGNKEVINALLTKGANVATLDRMGNEIIHIWAASNYKDENVLNLLLSRGATLDALNDSNKNLLHLAAENGQELPIKRFIQELDKKYFSKTTQVSVERAAYNRRGRYIGTQTVWESRTAEDLDTKKSYIKSFLDAKDNAGETPLLKLSKLPKEKWGIANNLAVTLINKGADVNLDNSAKITPLLAACSAGNTSLVKILIQRGANIYIADDKGNTPLHYAVQNGANDLVEYLIIIQNSNVTVKNTSNETPEALAIKLKKYDVAQLFSIYRNRTNDNNHNTLDTQSNTSRKQSKKESK
jgi:ankyrin repeat protein